MDCKDCRCCGMLASFSFKKADIVASCCEDVLSRRLKMLSGRKDPWAGFLDPIPWRISEWR